MLQNLVSDYVSVLDKSLTGGLTVPMIVGDAPVNDLSRRGVFAADGGAYQMVLDVPTDRTNVLVSTEFYSFMRSSDPTTDDFIVWARTVVSSSIPTDAVTGTNGDWLGFENMTYTSSDSKYAVVKSRFLVPNLSSTLEVGEKQYVQVAISNRSGEALNSSAVFKMRAYVGQEPFFQPLK